MRRRPQLTYVVKQGKDAGIILTPHRGRNGMFTASRGRFGTHYLVANEIDLITHLRCGRSIRMSKTDSKYHKGPSWITPASIKGWI
jgi:hypothetical protein